MTRFTVSEFDEIRTKPLGIEPTSQSHQLIFLFIIKKT